MTVIPSVIVILSVIVTPRMIVIPSAARDLGPGDTTLASRAECRSSN